MSSRIRFSLGKTITSSAKTNSIRALLRLIESGRYFERRWRSLLTRTAAER